MLYTNFLNYLTQGDNWNSEIAWPLVKTEILAHLTNIWYEHWSYGIACSKVKTLLLELPEPRVKLYFFNFLTQGNNWT